MGMDLVNPSPPSEDRRWRLVDGTMRRHGRQPHALIESLHTVQESFGYLDMEALRYVAAALRVPLSQVYGVATFYHFFSLKPQGQHTCVVCLGTACYIKGAASIVAAIEDTMHMKVGDTTADGQLSLLSARCLGSCGLAPAAVLDGEVVGKISEAQVLERIREWTSHDGGRPREDCGD